MTNLDRLHKERLNILATMVQDLRAELATARAHDADQRAALAQQAAEIARLREALERIATGNPAKPGDWLTDTEMAGIARATLAGTDEHPC